MIAAERHLSDGQLVRALDGEGSVAEARAWEAHLSRCERCAAELELLRSESRRVSDWLHRAAFETRSPVRRAPAVPWLRAAAILVLLAAPVAAIPAARSWVTARVVGPAAPAPRSAEPQAAAEAPTVRFVPTPGPFTIRFDAGATGSLVLERVDGGEAELTGVDGRADAMVSASLIRLRDGTGRYRLRLPGTVSGVEVVVGDRTVRVDAAGLDGGTTVRLSGS